MSTYTDPKTGFRISDTADTVAELERNLTTNRAATAHDRPPSQQNYAADIGQGNRGEAVRSIDLDRLHDTSYFIANKTRILQAAARGDLN